MSPGKILFGENEFLDLLQRSRVPPELILNENVRHRMISINRNYQETSKEPVLVVMKASPPHEIEVEPSEFENQYEEYEREKLIEETPKQNLKRKFTDSDYNFESQTSETPKKIVKRNIDFETPRENKKKKIEKLPDNWVVSNDG